LILTGEEDNFPIIHTFVDRVKFLEVVWESVPEDADLGRVAGHGAIMVAPPEPLQHKQQPLRGSRRGDREEGHGEVRSEREGVEWRGRERGHLTICRVKIGNIIFIN
jgi:hypothetical protein